MHPYIVHKIVPNMGCKVIPFNEKKLRESHKKHLEDISERNRKMIPSDVYEELKNKHTT